MMKSNLKQESILIMLFMMSPLFLFAGGGAPPATPIDGGLSLLLAAGGLYGIKKIKNRNKNI